MKRIFFLQILWCLLFSSSFLCSFGQDSTSIPFTFTLNNNARTSAGVFLTDGTLIRTLWNGVNYNAGNYTLTWDGKDDEGKLVDNSLCFIKVLSNNVTYTWEGVVGNTSDSMAGNNVFAGFHRIYGMAISGNYAYCCMNYSEGKAAQFKFALNDADKKIHLAETGGYGFGQMTNFVCADANNVYWGGLNPFSQDEQDHFIFATRVNNDSQTVFSSGSSYATITGKVYKSVIGKVTDTSGLITGMAVQQNGNYLFVSHRKLNKLKVYNKASGILVQDLDITDPNQLCVDGADNLWLHHDGIAEKFQVNTNGTITTTGLTINGLMILSMTCYGGNLILVDGNTQQVKAYGNNSGVLAWTLGSGESYQDPTVYNDKFYFKNSEHLINDGDLKSATALAFQPDGSFWIGDSYNSRLQKFNGNREFVTTLQYMQVNRSIAVDANNPNRVFCNFLEFEIDYSKPLAARNGSWTFIRNWGLDIPPEYTSEYFILYCVTTLPNGRTYALQRNEDSEIWQVVELNSLTGLRFTGMTFSIQNSTRLDVNGDIVSNTGRNNSGAPVYWYRKPLTGFDGANNPMWGIETVRASILSPVSDDPIFTPVIGWNVPAANDITSSGVTVSFESHGKAPWGSTKYALGGIRDNKWLWRTAKHTSANYEGEYPTDGSFDIGNEAEYTGGPIVIKERSIFWNYHGEFWKGAQTNKWQHVYDNGLLVGIFGKTSWEAWDGLDQNVWGLHAPPEIAGNVLSGGLIKSGDDYYLYHSDESSHAGVHRWKISGLNTLHEEVIVLEPFILKVNMITAKAYQTEQGIELEWTCENENENDSVKYEVERSNDMEHFEKAGTVPAKIPPASSINIYRWVDFKPQTENNYYRIKIITRSGIIQYSPILQVKFISGRNQFEIYPNPATNNYTTIKFNNIPEGMYFIRLIGSNGQLIVSKKIQHAGGSSIEVVNTSAALPKGTYHLQITGKGVFFNKQIVLQNR